MLAGTNNTSPPQTISSDDKDEVRNGGGGDDGEDDDEDNEDRADEDDGDNKGDDDSEDGDEDEGKDGEDDVYIHPFPESTKKIDGPGTAGKTTDAPWSSKQCSISNSSNGGVYLMVYAFNGTPFNISGEPCDR